MDLNLRLLRHAHVLADLGSFARAARVLGITQPALSRSIKTLESRIGARLFERSTHGVQLTDAGQLFLANARELMARAATGETFDPYRPRPHVARMVPDEENLTVLCTVVSNPNCEPIDER